MYEYMYVKAAPGPRNVHQATQMNLWICLKKDTFILLSKQCLNFTCSHTIHK